MSLTYYNPSKINVTNTIMKQDNHEILSWIQSLRGLAALAVVFVHVRYALPESWGGLKAALLPAAMGVDLFFVLSGFIMMLTTRHCDGTPRYTASFFIKRWARIWPLYLVVCVLTVAHGPTLHTAQWVAFAQGLFFYPVGINEAPFYFNMPVTVAWTLTYEVYFYVVFGASLLFGKWRWLALVVWFAITLIAIPYSMGSFSFGAQDPRPALPFAFANVATNPIVWDFIFGLVVGWIYLSPIRFSNVQGLWLAVAFSATLTVWASVAGVATSHGPNGWGWPMFSLVLSLALLSKATPIPFPRWTVWMGGISYSLYLIHILGFQISRETVAWLGIGGNDRVLLGHFVLDPMVAIIFAWLLYRIVEQPVSNAAREKGLLLIDALFFRRRRFRAGPAASPD